MRRGTFGVLWRNQVCANCLFGLLAFWMFLLGCRASIAQEEADAADAGYRSSVSLLSDAVQGMVAVENVPRLRETWQKTSLSQMQHDPKLREFIELNQSQFEAHAARIGLQTGLQLKDLLEAVSGEFVIAWLRFDAPKRPFSVAVLADTRGRDNQRNSLLKKMDDALRKRGATSATAALPGNGEMLVYTLPQKRGQLLVERAVVATIAGRLIITDRPETTTALVGALGEPQPGGLEQAKDFSQTFTHIASAHQQGEPVSADAPTIRWFARPIGMGMIARELAEVDRGRQVDILKLLQNQGFDAVKSIGGKFYFATEHYDVFHRGYVYAPPTVATAERYKLAARVLQFPNQEMPAPPSWVLPTAATFLQISWKMREAFWATESLVDEAFGSNVFRPALDGIREDKNGTQIDIENDIVANFTEDFYVMTENLVSEQGIQERAVSAIRIKNPARVAEVLDRAFSTDKDAERYDYPDHTIWEVRPSEDAAKDFEIDDGDFGFELETDVAEEDEPANQPLLDRSAFTVIDDYLMFSSHPELLVAVVEQSRQATPGLGEVDDYRRVIEAIEREGGQSRAFQRIIRNNLSWRAKYQLLQQGKFAESDSLLATVLRRIRERSETAQNREELKLDMSKLPPFEMVEKYLQPAGGYVSTTEDGWSIASFLLRKQD